jgi:hypothetical protein
MLLAVLFAANSAYDAEMIITIMRMLGFLGKDSNCSEMRKLRSAWVRHIVYGHKMSAALHIIYMQCCRYGR